MTVPVGPKGPLLLASPGVEHRGGAPSGVAEDLRPGLWAWKIRWSQRSRDQVPIVVLGDSSDLLTASFPEFGWPSQIAYTLRGNRHFSQSRGGVHWRTSNNQWTVSGTVTRPATECFDLGIETSKLANGAYIERAATCTGFEIYYTNGTGVTGFQTAIDGVASFTVTPGSTQGKRPDGMHPEGPFTRGSHTLRITGIGGSTFIGSVYAIDDDSGLGVRVYNGSTTAASASKFTSVTGWNNAMARLAKLNPALVIVAVGSTEYAANTSPATYAANLTSLAQYLRITCGPMTSVLYIHKHRRLDVSSPTYAWEEYRDVLRKHVEAQADSEMLDLSPHFPATQDGDYLNLIDSDFISLTLNGHALYADLICDHLTRQMAPRSAPSGVGATITGTAPSALSGVLAAWRGSDLTSGTISSWPTYAGTFTNALVPPVGREPSVGQNASQINNKKYASFANAGTGAAGSMLQTTSWGSKQNVPLSVGMVFRRNRQRGYMFSGRSSAAFLQMWAHEFDGDLLEFVNAGHETTPGASAMWNSFGTWTAACLVANGTSSKYFMSGWVGAQALTISTNAQNAAAALQGVTLGANYSNSNCFDGDFAEFIVYNRALTDAEAQGVVDYFARQYGLDRAARTSVAP